MDREAMLRELNSILTASAGTSDETHALIYRLAVVVSVLVTEPVS